MALQDTNQDTSSLHFSDHFSWRLGSSAIWLGLVIVVLIIGILATPLSLILITENLPGVWFAIALLVPAMALIIASGGVDLSVGAVSSCAGIVAVRLILIEKMDLEGALIIGLCSALLIGIVNGFLIGVIRYNAAIVTLATSMVVSGSIGVLKGERMDFEATARQVQFSGLSSIYGFAIALLLLLIVVCIVANNRKLVVNSERRAWSISKAMRMRQSLLIALPYVLSSTMAGLVGAYYLVAHRQTLPAIMTGLQLDAVLIVLLGGTTLGGGFVNIVGAMLATLVVVIVKVALPEKPLAELALKGAGVLVFVLLSHTYHRAVNLMFRRLISSAKDKDTGEAGSLMLIKEKMASDSSGTVGSYASHGSLKNTCPHCGEYNRSTALYCQSCGKKLSSH